jgi:tetratricopeptide (TPR) repeat protein
MNKHSHVATSLLFFIMLLTPGIYSNAQTFNSRADSMAFLIQRDGNDTNKLYHLNMLGWELMYQDPDSSIKLGNQALALGLSLYEEEGSRNNNGFRKAVIKQIGLSYNCLGVYYWITCDFDQSIQFHKKSMEIWKLTGSKTGQSSSYNNLGVVYKTKADYSNAIKNYFAALELGIEIGDKELISAGLSNIGTVYYDMNDQKKALEFFFMALRLYKQTGDLVGVSMTYGYIGSVYKEEHRMKESLQCYKTGLKISKDMDNTYLIAYQMNNIGEIYLADSNYRLAIDHFQIALENAQSIGDGGLIAAILENMGSSYFYLNDYVKAKKYLKEGLKLAEEIGVPDIVQSTAFMLSKLYAHIGNMDLAYQFHVQYTDMNDSLFNEKQTKEIGRIETRHEVEMEARNKQLAEQEKKRLIQQKKFRGDLLQYSGIILFLVLVGLIILVLGHKKVSLQMASGVTFFAFLLLFEFLLVLLDPYVDLFSKGEPAFKLLANVLLAAAIFPIHAFFEKRVRWRLAKK